MWTAPKSILIVDDNATLRGTLSLIFNHAGYRVTCSADGFSALVEMRRAVPQILLSDLNMPGMSGFELLSVVRRRFPEIRVIAMSGAFEQDRMPAGVAADEFYRKGQGAGALFELVQRLSASSQPPIREAETSVWVSSGWLDTCNPKQIAIACPECMRVFPERLGNQTAAGETRCSHCSTRVRLAWLHPIFETDMTGLEANAQINL